MGQRGAPLDSIPPAIIVITLQLPSQVLIILFTILPEKQNQPSPPLPTSQARVFLLLSEYREKTSP